MHLPKQYVFQNWGGFHPNCDCKWVDICGLLGANQNVGECCANEAS
jgi:hypothetical protein